MTGVGDAWLWWWWWLVLRLAREKFAWHAEADLTASLSPPAPALAWLCTDTLKLAHALLHRCPLAPPLQSFKEWLTEDVRLDRGEGLQQSGNHK